MYMEQIWIQVAFNCRLGVHLGYTTFVIFSSRLQTAAAMFHNPNLIYNLRLFPSRILYHVSSVSRANLGT